MPPSPSPASYSSRRRWTTAEARAVLSAFAASGLSLSAFSEREGLDPQRLRSWRSKLDKERGAAALEFVEIRPRVETRVEIVLRSGVVVRVAESIDAAALRRLIGALEPPPC